jgi:UDP-N-acetylmuramoyl-tripeptide--D-alanyl-D-alanine ligase
MKLTLEHIGKAMEAVGDFESEQDLVVSRIQTDSRLIEPGDLFVCIPGEHFDGHRFAAEAVHKGALAVVSEHPLPQVSEMVPVLLVHNSLKALGRLGLSCRNRFQGTVVAVTGTAGKTTVKEFLASMLARVGSVGKNYKNWNTQLGVPLSITGFTGLEDYWVLEAGVSVKGDMDELGELIQPDVAVITNIGAAHLEGLGDLRGVAREKAALLKYLRPGGWAVRSSDYPLLETFIPPQVRGREVIFSLRQDRAEYSGEYLGLDAQGLAGYRLLLAGEAHELTLDMSGTFVLENVLAAAATAHSLGMSGPALLEGLQQASIPEHRCQVHRLGSWRVIDDCYNANPLSMRLALANAKDVAKEGPLLLLLGDMLELGEQSEEEHERLGSLAAATGADKLFYVGRFAPSVRSGFSSSAPEERFETVQDTEEFLQAWRRLNARQGTILVKGSRGCRLEAYVSALSRELEA